MALTLVKLAWVKYLTQLQLRPLQTKAVTSGVFGVLSDLLAQQLSGSRTLQLRLALLMGLYGFLYVGPSAHYVHKLLDRIFGRKTDTNTAVKKVAVEQLTYGPICCVLGITYISAIVDGQSWSQTGRKLATAYPTVQINGWKLWPLASLINHKYVPLQFRVLFVNFVALFWSTFLILQTRSSGLKADRLIKSA